MKLGFLSATVLVFSSNFCMADTAPNLGWYAGLDIGSSRYNTDEPVDDSDISFTGFGGFRFSKHFAIQGSAFSLGTYEALDDLDYSVDVGGVSFTANGIIPIKQSGFELYGRLGLGILTYTQKFDFSDIKIESSSTGDAIVSSVGAQYTPPSHQRFTFHIEFSNYYFETERPYTDEDDESNSLLVIGIGGKFNF